MKNKPTEPTEQEKQNLEERLKKIHQNHPNCVPILFLKHPEAPNHVKPPTTPMILFQKSLKIEQAMYALYKQIEQKGLYFFTPYLVKDKIRYKFLEPGVTIESVYKDFGRAGYLTLVYSDKQLGMQGILSMQKWMIRFLVFIGLIWVFLYGYSYYLSSQAGSAGSQAGSAGQAAASSFGETIGEGDF